MKWIVREPFEGGAYLDCSMEGMGPAEMSTQRAWLFDTEEQATAALDRASKGHAKTTLVVAPIVNPAEVERLREIEAQVLALYDNATATHRGDLGWYQAEGEAFARLTELLRRRA